MQKTSAACARRTVLTFLATAGVLLATGLATAAHAADKSFTMGFAQVGAESEWRTANSESIKSTAKAQGVNLKFSDAQQKQENQI
jgi:simple sugar transport system substrate-binding protein